jgi:hypothetical protein
MNSNEALTRSTARPMRWIAAAVVLVGLVLAGRWAVPASLPTMASTPTPFVVTAPLLDRGAERQPAPTPRTGGPGGQIGDATPGT